MVLNYGKIVEFDGNVGNITDINGKKYLLLKHELKDDLEKNDYVVFKAETYKSPEINENIARFVKKLSKDVVIKK